MAVIDSYSSLVTEVGAWLARSNLTGAIPGFIQNWEERFYRNSKNHGRWMERSFAQTTSNGVIPVPADFLRWKTARLANRSRLEIVSVEQLYGKFPRGHTGIPQWIAREVGNFVFGPQPEGEYDVEGVYYGKPTLLRNSASDATGNWFILNAPDLALYGALLQSAPYNQNDARIMTWQAMYDGALRDYQDLIKAESITGPVQEVLS